MGGRRTDARREHAGNHVPEHELHVIEDRPVLVVRRFDRDARGAIGYLSAMSMLQAKDGEQASYLEIAEAIEERSPDAGADLHELWRRIVFTILISNTDDHLRNHGFLRKSTAGWSLSPAFDLNPNPEGAAKQLATAIDENNTEASLATALECGRSVQALGGPGSRRSSMRCVPRPGAGRRWPGQWVSATPELQRLAPAFEHEQRLAAREFVGAPN